MKKKKSNQILITALLLMLLIFIIVAVVASRSAYNKKVAGEKITEPDFYSMTDKPERG